VALARAGGSSPQSALMRFFVAEAVKVALVIAMFVVVLKTVNVSPLAMLGAFAATFVVYWIALIATLPASSGVQRGT